MRNCVELLTDRQLKTFLKGFVSCISQVSFDIFFCSLLDWRVQGSWWAWSNEDTTITPFTFPPPCLCVLPFHFFAWYSTIQCNTIQYNTHTTLLAVGIQKSWLSYLLQLILFNRYKWKQLSISSWQSKYTLLNKCRYIIGRIGGGVEVGLGE